MRQKLSLAYLLASAAGVRWWMFQIISMKSFEMQFHKPPTRSQMLKILQNLYSIDVQLHDTTFDRWTMYNSIEDQTTWNNSKIDSLWDEQMTNYWNSERLIGNAFNRILHNEYVTITAFRLCLHHKCIILSNDARIFRERLRCAQISENYYYCVTLALSGNSVQLLMIRAHRE